MASSFKIGSTLVGITSLDLLTTPVVDPKTEFIPYSQIFDLGSGLKLAAGWPRVTWTYGYLTQAQRDQLRTFCTGLSAEVFITTRTRDSSASFKTYKAVMIWPETENYRASRRLDMIFQFIRLELQT